MIKIAFKCIHASLIRISFLALLGACSKPETVLDSPGTPAVINYTVEKAFPNVSFTRPVDLQNCGDDRIFVVEQAGRIISFRNDPFTAISSVFLDIHDRVNSIGNEEGLLGLAFDPNYKSNGYFYLNYTASQPRRTVIARYSIHANDSNLADQGSEKIILEINQPYSNHNGGQLAFGPDGYLYIATGDGGSGGDPQGNAQNLNSLLGKILRIDVHPLFSTAAFSIPPDNPFVGRSGRDEIWAFGLRNPWRMSFDTKTHILWAADVGQDEIEEIDIIEKGKNYGWNLMEGNTCYKNPSCDSSGLSMPVFQYNHSSGVSITGGFVYRGKKLYGLIGKYIYTDFLSGNIWAIESDSTDTYVNSLLMKSGLNVSSFGVDRDQEIYLCSFDGKIYRFAK